jgi:hypothetical protein
MGAITDRIAIANYRFPLVNLTDYDHLSIDITGTNNSLVLFRVYLENGTPVNVAQWSAPHQISNLDLRSFDNSRFRGDAYISVISSDGLPASVTLEDLSLVKLVPISMKTMVLLDIWSVDSRYSIGPYSYSGGEEMHLGLDVGDAGDRLTIITEDFPKCNLSEYNYLKVRVSGSSNSRVLLRIYLENGSNVDFAYWVDLNYFDNLIPISDIVGSTRGQAFIGLESTDGNPSWIRFTEISLIKTNGM